jgi:ribosomal protein S18 acetylase RimI-like enzyme
MTDLRVVSPDDPATAPLVAGLHQEYIGRYGSFVADEVHLYDALEFVPPVGAFVIVQNGFETVAGGALRRFADGVGEIKRMWTAPSHRGRGHARRVLAALEETAARVGYRSVRLQTGTLQTEAIGLYRSAGYRPIAAYGRYADDERCVSFQKALA